MVLRREKLLSTQECHFVLVFIVVRQAQTLAVPAQIASAKSSTHNVSHTVKAREQKF